VGDPLLELGLRGKFGIEMDRIGIPRDASKGKNVASPTVRPISATIPGWS
jgi:hypothetical protein